MTRTGRALIAIGCGYLGGGVPFAQLVAHRARGVDLRSFGSGTVSGTSVYRLAGIGPMLLAGLGDVAKGAGATLLARRLAVGPAPGLEAAAGAAAVTGHNWSPYLGGAGGRGIAPALGALSVQAPLGALLLLAGLGLGRAAGQTGLGCGVAYAGLVPILGRLRGRPGALAGASVVVPMVAKRLTGNGTGLPREPGVLAARLLLDRDGWSA